MPALIDTFTDALRAVLELIHRELDSLVLADHQPVDVYGDDRSWCVRCDTQYPCKIVSAVLARARCRCSRHQAHC
jgi:hypothetical protein